MTLITKTKTILVKVNLDLEYRFKQALEEWKDEDFLDEEDINDKVNELVMIVKDEYNNKKEK